MREMICNGCGKKEKKKFFGLCVPPGWDEWTIESENMGYIHITLCPDCDWKVKHIETQHRFKNISFERKSIDV